ncbi:hypothetical protein PR001_g22428 [Phytophthora rubi]|nr:hypothetical protein PR001_g22428 [Phytophthora rubi]
MAGLVDVNAAAEVPALRMAFVILHFFALQDKPRRATSSMSTLKFSLAVFCLAFAMLLSLVTAEAEQVRNLSDAGSSIASVPLAAVVGIAAAAAVAVVLLVVVKVRSSGGSRRPKGLELHEVVISPSQPAAQPLSTTKQFVYTAHI